MPLLKTEVPRFERGESTSQRIDAILNYLIQLQDSLNYALQLTRTQNQMEKVLADYVTLEKSDEALKLAIKNAEGNMLAEIQITAGAIATEVSRATEAEGNLSSRITQNAEAITSEVERAGGAEGALSSRITQTAEDITSEVTRATGAEESLGSRITQNAEAITAEVTRASGAEGALGSRITQTAEAITAEVTRASAAEGTLSSQITQTAESITSEVSSTYETKTDAGGKLTEAKSYADSQIRQSATSIESNVALTYETKSDASGKLTAAKTYADSQIRQTAAEISSTVSQSMEKYDTAGYNVSLYGFGDPDLAGIAAEEHQGGYYLNSENGAVYYSESSTEEGETIWFWVLEAFLEPITYGLRSQITQNAGRITSEVTRATGAEDALGSRITQTESNITSTVAQTYETKTDASSKLTSAQGYADAAAGAAETNANDYTDGKLTNYSTTVQMRSEISQTASTIQSNVSAAYETKDDASGKLTAAKAYADSQIRQTAAEISSTVSQAFSKYDTTGYSIDVYGFGDPDITGVAAADHQGEYYLDNENGALYHSESSVEEGETIWFWVAEAFLELVTDKHASRITQNANKIAVVVDGNNAIRAAQIVAAVNGAGSSVIIDADHIDLTGCLTATDVGENGSTVIDGARVKTGSLKLYGELSVYKNDTSFDAANKSGSIGSGNVIYPDGTTGQELVLRSADSKSVMFVSSNAVTVMHDNQGSQSYFRIGSNVSTNANLVLQGKNLIVSDSSNANVAQLGGGAGGFLRLQDTSGDAYTLTPALIKKLIDL